MFEERISKDEFEKWLKTAKPNDRVCYAIASHVSVGGGRQDIAEVAYKASENGEIEETF